MCQLVSQFAQIWAGDNLRDGHRRVNIRLIQRCPAVLVRPAVFCSNTFLIGSPDVNRDCNECPLVGTRELPVQDTHLREQDQNLGLHGNCGAPIDRREMRDILLRGIALFVFRR